MEENGAAQAAAPEPAGDHMREMDDVVAGDALRIDGANGVRLNTENR